MELASISRRSWFVLALGAVFAGCASGQPRVAQTAMPAIPTGTGRIYVYREMNYEALSYTAIEFNGQQVGAAGPGSVFFRDVPPGSYRITARTRLYQPDQARTVDVAAGESAYVRVIAIPTPVGGNDGTDAYTSFVLEVMDPVTGAKAIQGLAYAAP